MITVILYVTHTLNMSKENYNLIFFRTFCNPNLKQVGKNTDFQVKINFIYLKYDFLKFNK